MRTGYPLILIFWLPVANFVQAQAQRSGVNGFALNGHYGFIFAHSEAVQNTSGARPFAFQLEADRQLLDSQVWDLCHCYPHKGVLLNYTNYDVALLGFGLKTAYYLEPTFLIGRHAEIGLRAGAGISWSSDPFDSLDNPANQSYSTVLNAYLVLGFNTSFRLGKRWQFNTFLQYNHISNGGLKNPNKGINWPTAGAGFRYRLSDVVIPGYTKRVSGGKQRQLRFDQTLFYTSRIIKPGETKRFSIVGVQVQVSKNKGGLHGWSAALEYMFDGALRERMHRQGLQQKTYWLPGVQVGHEFLLGKFIFSQQVGVYLADYGPYYNLIYHRWSLWYRINQSIGIGTSLKAHSQVANFVDARVVYSINRR